MNRGEAERPPEGTADEAVLKAELSFLESAHKYCLAASCEPLIHEIKLTIATIEHRRFSWILSLQTVQFNESWTIHDSLGPGF